MVLFFCMTRERWAAIFLIKNDNTCNFIGLHAQKALSDVNDFLDNFRYNNCIMWLASYLRVERRRIISIA